MKTKSKIIVALVKAYWAAIGAAVVTVLSVLVYMIVKFGVIIVGPSSSWVIPSAMFLLATVFFYRQLGRNDIND